MDTSAKGLLAVWTDVEPAAEADFNAWYDGEHLAERAAIAGFLNARRYLAVDSAPRYFAAYDTERLATLGAPTYAKALANQSDWSRRVMAHFRNPTRMIAALAAEHGTGIGGAMLTLRLGLAGGRAAEIAAALREHLAGNVVGRPGIVRCCLAVGVVAGLADEAQTTAARAAEAPDTAALLVEGTALAPLRVVAAGPLRAQTLLDVGAGDLQQSGFYRLHYAIVGAP